MTPTASPVMLETAQGALPLRYSVEQVPDDSDGQVRATIARMCDYVNADCQAGPVLYDAQAALASNPNDVLAAVHSAVRARLCFRNDEALAAPFTGLLKRPADDYFVEVLKRPVDVCIEYAANAAPVEGDCDDYSMLCAALLRALGIDCCFATVAADKEQPGVFSHVYTVAYWRGKRVPMDCSHGPHAGWEYAAPGAGYRLQEWPIVPQGQLAACGLAFIALGWLAWRNRDTIREWLRP